MDHIREGKQRILVAGATGYLGRHVVRELQSHGFKVRALVRSRAKLERLGLEPDEVAVGEVTRPETLKSVCEGVDQVFSCVGITRQRDGLTFRDVDYQGNLNLLRSAERAGVQGFVYVSAFGAARWRKLDIMAAHEDFVDALKASALDWRVLRPTGYFSDLESFFEMAQSGRVYLLGRGTTRVNPIHGADLAAVCADVLAGRRTDREIDVGGPEVLTWNQVATLAFEAAERPVRVVRIPMGLVSAAVAAVRLINRHRGELMRFFAASGRSDFVAPRYGSRSLGDHFASLAQDKSAEVKGSEAKGSEVKGSEA